MLPSLKRAAFAAAVLGGLAGHAMSASALPIAPSAAMIQSGSVVAPEPVRWVCGPYRCFHRPNFYRPHYFYRPYRWHRWHHFGYWHRPFGWHRHHHWW